jgi:hypothetical protein
VGPRSEIPSWHAATGESDSRRVMPSPHAGAIAAAYRRKLIHFAVAIDKREETRHATAE